MFCFVCGEKELFFNIFICVVYYLRKPIVYKLGICLIPEGKIKFKVQNYGLDVLWFQIGKYVENKISGKLGIKRYLSLPTRLIKRYLRLPSRLRAF